MKRIADLHADLLCYLANDMRKTAYDAAVRCSIPFLNQGKVALQVLPVFTETGKGSALKGTRQAHVFADLPARYPEAFGYNLSATLIEILLAVENASSFFEEDEPLEIGLERLSALIAHRHTPLYIGLTWNSENRFGGGAHTSIGLKADGQKLIDFMAKHRIALDLSHTSDPLAWDLLNYVDRQAFTIPILASHSNSRTIASVPRNLPDELAKEIFRRGGVIGLNFYRPFVGGDSMERLGRHLEHFIQLGGEKQVCFGADFHCGEDVSPIYRKSPHETFFSGYADASAYGDLLGLWQKTLGFSEEILNGIAYDNLERFLRKIHH